jgi:hypothetical protein
LRLSCNNVYEEIFCLIQTMTEAMMSVISTVAVKKRSNMNDSVMSSDNH